MLLHLRPALQVLEERSCYASTGRELALFPKRGKMNFTLSFGADSYLSFPFILCPVEIYSIVIIPTLSVESRVEERARTRESSSFSARQTIEQTTETLWLTFLFSRFNSSLLSKKILRANRAITKAEWVSVFLKLVLERLYLTSNLNYLLPLGTYTGNHRTKKGMSAGLDMAIGSGLGVHSE